MTLVHSRHLLFCLIPIPRSHPPAFHSNSRFLYLR